MLAGRGAWLRYGAPAILVGVVALLRFAATPVMGYQAPFLPFAFAVFAACYLSGVRAAILCTLLAVFAATVLFAEAQMPADPVAWVGHVTLFAVLSALVMLMMHRLQVAYELQRYALADARANRDQMRLITNGLPVLIAYCDTDQRFRFNNRAYADWFRRPTEEFLGKSMRDVVGEDTYEAIAPHIQEVLAGKPTRFETEITIRQKVRHVSAYYIPDFGRDRTVRGWFALVEDITERKRAALSLKDARMRLSLALRAGRSGTFEWDMVADKIVWSEELLELHGLKSHEFGGNREAWLGCVHPDDVTSVLAATERAFRSDEATVDYRIRRRDTGEVRWLHGRGRVFFDSNHNPVRMIGIGVDVTERKAAEEALRLADRHKDEFLAMLAHELRNPLGPIRNVAHLLLDETADLEVMRSCGELFERQVSILARLVDDLLDVARIRRGLIEIKREPTDIETIVDGAIETLEPSLSARHQRVRVSRPRARVLVDGDAVRLGQVFVNLLSNASKFSPEFKPIYVLIGEDASGVVVHVRDLGDGIDAQSLPRVFDLFMQGDTSLDRPQGGLGIGLALVKRIVELHQGSVQALSQGLGAGSEFIVRLPRAGVFKDQPCDETPRPEEVPIRRRILIIEDNRDAARALELLLEVQGHEIGVAHDGVAAIMALKTFEPDVIFSDIGLPGIDGYTLVGILRQQAKAKTARIYALTGYGQPADRRLALAMGFDGHLTKPVDPKELLRLLREGVNHHATLFADDANTR